MYQAQARSPFHEVVITDIRSSTTELLNFRNKDKGLREKGQLFIALETFPRLRTLEHAEIPDEHDRKTVVSGLTEVRDKLIADGSPVSTLVASRVEETIESFAPIAQGKMATA